MLINCGHPSNRQLSKEIVNTANGGWLHGLSWLKDNEIGELPSDLNWIAGSSPSNVAPKVIHYSEGGPWMADYEECPFSDIWYDYLRSMQDDLPMPADSLKSIKYGDA